MPISELAGKPAPKSLLIDVAKLETLEPAMVSIKVTAAINDILNEDGRLLTDTDRGRLVEERVVVEGAANQLARDPRPPSETFRSHPRRWPCVRQH